MIKYLQTMFLALMLSTVSQAYGADTGKRKICVFDEAGSHGELFTHMKNFQIEALSWGVEIELKAYTEEKVASEDFKTGLCDGAVLSGLRTRPFNLFTGTLSAFGAAPTQKHVKLALGALSNPKLAPRMKNGIYEIAGILPVGGAYLFLNDRTMNTPAQLSGKKIAVMDYDKAQIRLATQFGASPVMVDITTFAGKFNNGSIDVCGAPLEAYSLMELYKGLDPKGGIISEPVLQVTDQLIINNEKFPPDFGQKSRKYMYSLYSTKLDQIVKTKSNVDNKWWVDVPSEDLVGYYEIGRQVRISNRDAGIYDGDMLRLLKRVRCKIDGSAGECTDSLE